MNRQPLVAVVTVNWNTAKETLQCVDSVLKSDYSNLSLLVVDNGSRPGELGILQSGLPPKVELLALDKNYGYVGGVNRGLKRAEELLPEYYLVMNNDTVLDQAAVSELVKAAARQQNNCIVTGIVYDYHQPEIIQQTGSKCINRRRLVYEPLHRNVRDPGLLEEDVEMDMIDDVFWLLPRSVIKKVGYYCNHFWFNDEQADYALRAIKTGFKLMFTPKAKLWHRGSLSIGGKARNPVRAYFDLKARLLLRYRHLNRIDFTGYYLSVVASLIKASIKILIKCMLNKEADWKAIEARFLGFRDFNKWMFNKQPDTGAYPKVIKRT